MNSPFKSIFEHEKEHQLMIDNGAGNNLSIGSPYFIPSPYSDTYSATTTIDNQWEKLATGTKKLFITNKSTTEGQSAIVGFGNTVQEAKDAVTNQSTYSYFIPADTPALIPTNSLSYMAWVATTATVNLRISQGV